MGADVTNYATIRTAVTERPFIVDSLREFLSAQDMAIENMVYPVMHVERAGGPSQ